MIGDINAIRSLSYGSCVIVDNMFHLMNITTGGDPGCHQSAGHSNVAQAQ